MNDMHLDLDNISTSAPMVAVIAPPKVHVTFFRDAQAARLTTDSLTLYDLRERILNASAREKSKLPWLKLAVFGAKPTNKNSLRHDANVVAISGIEIDYDGDKIAFADVLDILTWLRIHSLIYTSPSHTADKPHWRILAPTTRNLPPAMRAKLVARLNGVLLAKLGADEVAADESATLSQAFYYGYVINKPDLDHRAEVIEGDCIDLRDDLAEFDVRGMVSVAAANKAATVSTDDDRNVFEKLADDGYHEAGRLTDRDIRELLRKHEGGSGDGWHKDMLAVTNELLIRGFDPLAIHLTIQSACKNGFDDRDIGKLIDKKWDEYQAERREAARAAKREQTPPPLPQQKQQVDPVDLWGKFEPPSLPRGLLPDVIERFAFDQGTDMGADMSGIAMAALAVCAAAIPDNIQLQVKRNHSDWLESARLWVALVGPPSAKKTPIIATAARPLRRIDAKQARHNAEARATYDRLQKDEKTKTDPPKQTRYVLQDTTIEAAQDILKDSPDGVLCYQDELSGWFGAMDKYSPGRGSAKDRAFWMEAYNGGSYSVHRVGRGSVFIENLSVSLIGGIQPEPIRQIAEDSVDDGLLQRPLPIMVRPAVVGQDEKASPVIAEYEALVGWTNGLGAKFLRFDEGAQRYRQELEVRHLKLESLEIVHRKLATHFGKYNGIFARLCVVWHCIENADRLDLAPVISEATARRVGAFLHSFLLPHAVSFYAGVLGLANDHDAVTAVGGYILAHGLAKVTNRDLKRGDQTMRRLDTEQARAVFEQLQALGWLDCIPSPRRGRPDHWTVNPAVHQKFAARAKSEAERRAAVRQIILEEVGGNPEL